MYGETSFELICQILDKLSPVGPDNKFIDLGSGVGQVVLQVAALTDCEMTFGIEKASTPANYAKVCNCTPPSAEPECPNSIIMTMLKPLPPSTNVVPVKFSVLLLPGLRISTGTKWPILVPFCRISSFTDIWHLSVGRLLRPANVTYLKTDW